MRTRILTVLVLSLTTVACQKDSEKKESAPATPTPASQQAAAQPKPIAPPKRISATEENPGEWMKKAQAGQELFATMKTNLGTVVMRLFSKEAPKTVANFVGLATGEKTWVDPKTGEAVQGRPLYDGVIFHRVIPGFMIQGGDPMGSGRGDPGYRFEDETSGANAHTFAKVGLLAMANAGPNTNGSQFFITTSMPNWLNGKHTIFGEVVQGYDVVEKISNVPRGPGDRPNEPVVIENIAISDQNPAGAK